MEHRVRLGITRRPIPSNASDTVVLVRGANQEECMQRATCGVRVVVGCIRLLGLNMALGKTEVLVLRGPRSQLDRQ